MVSNCGKDVLDSLNRFCRIKSRSVFASILRQCDNEKFLPLGKRIHAHILRDGHSLDTFLGNLLILMYGKCGMIDYAVVVFDSILKKNVFSWSIMIVVYAHSGNLHKAQRLFDVVPQRNVVTWTTMVSAYAEHGYHNNAIQLFKQMPMESIEPNEASFVSILSACTGSLAEGKHMHAYIIQYNLGMNLVVLNALINMYGKCDSVGDALVVFEKMPERNVISWNATIAAYNHEGNGKGALDLFDQMEKCSIVPDRVTFLNLFEACTCELDINVGKHLHQKLIQRGLESDASIGTVLIKMYGKCRNVKDARAVFDKIAKRDVHLWTAMITVYAENGDNADALYLFHRMQTDGLCPNDVTYIGILNACAEGTKFHRGRKSRALVTSKIFNSHTLSCALVSLYAKSGSLEEASQIFWKLKEKGVRSWNSILGAYAQHGNARKSLKLFKRMHLTGVLPDNITFVNILSAFTHAGDVIAGIHTLLSITSDYGIIPGIEHYHCLIDLLAKAGYLDIAEQVVYSLPVKPTTRAYVMLLSACNMVGDLQRGEHVAELVHVLNEDIPAVYVLLSNIYSAADI